MAHINFTICELYEFLQSTVITRISEKVVKSQLLQQIFEYDRKRNIFYKIVNKQQKMWNFERVESTTIFIFKNGCTTETMHI